MTKTRYSPMWKVPEKEFKRLVEESTSYSEMLAKVGFKNKGRNALTLKARIAELGLCTAHVKRHCQPPRTRLSVEQVCVENSPHSRNTVRRLILRHGLLPYYCEKCEQLPEWKGEPLVLVLDHKNGKDNDHRLENLRWLCPNCNSQTTTFAGRNRRK